MTKKPADSWGADRIGVIALVPDCWQGIWGTRHHVLSRLARQFEVVWVEPSTGWRDYWPRKSPAKAHGNDNPWIDIPGLTVFDPGRWLAEVYKPAQLGNWLRHRRIASAHRTLRSKGCQKIVLYLWRPQFAWGIQATDIDLTCYHIDDEYQFSPIDQPDDPIEVELINKSDLVIIHSPKLLEKKGGLNPDTIFVPNGVNFAQWSAKTSEPRDLAEIPRPRAGYIGVIKSQLDFALLLTLTEKCPDWSFVFVGPRGTVEPKQSLLKELEGRANTYFLGNRLLPELPGYAQHLDACMMCYEVNDYTNCIYPLKIHEYLAASQPVISSPIRAVKSFDHVVRIAHDAEEWQSALVESLESTTNSSVSREARRAVAAKHDWDILTARIADAIRERLSAAP